MNLVTSMASINQGGEVRVRNPVEASSAVTTDSSRDALVPLRPREEFQTV
jgi:hypothetical protein